MTFIPLGRGDGEVSAFLPYSSQHICSQLLGDIVNAALQHVQETDFERMRLLRSPITPLDGYHFSGHYSELIELLRELSISNKRAPMTKTDKENLMRKVAILSQDESCTNLLIILKILSQYTTEITLDLFCSTLDKLKKNNPWFEEYLVGHDPALTPKSIDIIIRIFEEDFGFQKDVLATIPAEDVAERIMQIMLKVEDVVQGFVVYNKDKDDLHVTPVFVKKEGDKTQVFICNSLGEQIIIGGTLV